MTESPHPDPLAFTPVSCRARHDGWTPERQRRFIKALSVIGVVAAAARAVGKSATTAYRLRERPDAASFAAAWDMALLMGQERALGVALDRALNGYEAPRFYRGKQVGTVRKIDHRLTIAALRQHQSRPAAPLTPAEQAQVDWLLGGDPDTPPPSGIE